MPSASSPRFGSIAFLRIWHNVFVLNLEYTLDHVGACDYLDPAVVVDDRACQMGRWLQAQPPEIAGLEDFQHLDAVHRSFHQLAAELARRHVAGQAIDDDWRRRFEQASDETLAAMTALENGLSGTSTADTAPAGEGFAQKIWDPSFEVGEPRIDRRHHAIAMLIEQVLLNPGQPWSGFDARSFLSVFSRMLQQEILAETPWLERMAATDPGHVAAHRREHQRILEELAELDARADAGEIPSLETVGQRLAGWYVEHLVAYDLELQAVVRAVAGEDAGS